MQLPPLSNRFLTLCFAVSLVPSGAASAQTMPVGSATQSAPAQAAPDQEVMAQRIEHIHLEDAGAVIDELRIGGQTKSIRVQPRGRLPAYQVEPASGERHWKVLGF
ncbi:MAG: hypothetical protein JZU64_05205 [Rhodoferax sp.]|jgi:hypothetical protein|nr:hypothetical protein [Rhodoferax sp.]